MAVCEICGKEFDVSRARRVLGRAFYAGCYNETFPDGDVCEDCAYEHVSADIATGRELAELMGSGYDD